MVGRSTGRDQDAVRWLYRLAGLAIIGRYAYLEPRLTPLLFVAAMVLLGFDRFVLNLVALVKGGDGEASDRARRGEAPGAGRPGTSEGARGARHDRDGANDAEGDRPGVRERRGWLGWARCHLRGADRVVGAGAC